MASIGCKGTYTEGDHAEMTEHAARVEFTKQGLCPCGKTTLRERKGTYPFRSWKEIGKTCPYCNSEREFEHLDMSEELLIENNNKIVHLEGQLITRNNMIMEMNTCGVHLQPILWEEAKKKWGKKWKKLTDSNFRANADLAEKRKKNSDLRKKLQVAVTKAAAAKKEKEEAEEETVKAKAELKAIKSQCAAALKAMEQKYKYTWDYKLGTAEAWRTYFPLPKVMV